jgi:rare lipoprotein A
MRLPAVAFSLGALLFSAGCGSSLPRSSATGGESADHSEGIASYYAEEFNGRQTASGEVYDMEGLTAAHPTLPFNTRVRVTNLDNGKSVVVRINDRGPFKKGRILDLSYRAARLIGLIPEGTAPVRMEVLPAGQTDQ